MNVYGLHEKAEQSICTVGISKKIVSKHDSRNTQESIFFFFKENQIFGFPWCSTREDLSIDVSITNVELILTKPR